MSEVYHPPENGNENENGKGILRDDVLSTDDTKNLENLTRSEYIVEDFIEKKEDDKIEEGKEASFHRENILRGSSIITQDDGADSASCKSEKKSESFLVNTSHDRITEEGAMQTAKQIDEVTVGEFSHGKDDGATPTREVIKEAAPIAATRSSKLSANVNGDEVVGKTSRHGTVKTDGRKLKTATLDRVGRMFKSRPSSSDMNKTPPTVDSAMNIPDSDGKYSEQPSRKEKTNSLGRMLKLVDKDGAPKKLFTHPRAGSLSRIFRKHSTTETNEAIDRTEEESPGIFSRMFNHLRGRSASSGNRTNPNNVRERAEKGKASLPPKVPVASKLPSGIPSRPPLSGSSSSSSTMPEKHQQLTRPFQRTSNVASYEP
ncbi:hypothetical protein KPH14_008628 [Odynerus spinipes]|uniref:Uncharacterized protein n=1 Tax=Odynerus spinipes TaxID=1348599 RepID=A0AAD9RSG8_9HYME|nr:hypothetical protein KPH14_008628 [Odynerus spinipes]